MVAGVVAPLSTATLPSGLETKLQVKVNLLPSRIIGGGAYGRQPWPLQAWSDRGRHSYWHMVDRHTDIGIVDLAVTIFVYLIATDLSL